MSKTVVVERHADRKNTVLSLLCVKNLVTTTPKMGYKLEIPRLGTEGNLVTALKAGLTKLSPSLTHNGCLANEGGHDMVSSFRRALCISHFLSRTKTVTDGTNDILNRAVR